MLREAWRERAGHPVSDDHLAHLVEVIAWLERAQDATPGGGVSRGFSLRWDPYFRRTGWQPAYPETTGYIIPTLLQAARLLSRPDLRERALRAARWEIAVQLPSGAVQGGVIGEEPTPAIFNTGQVMLGWLAAYDETGSGEFADAVLRAGAFLAGAIDADGHWRRDNSRYASAATLYNARSAWALAEAGCRLAKHHLIDAASRNLRATVERQHVNGWFPECCLSDPERPLLHTIAYTVRGLVEGGRVLEDDRLLRVGAHTAERLMELVREDGWMAGRFAADWAPSVTWSCLTGQAQIANSWLRLHRITGEARWLEPVPRVLRFVKATQNRSSGNPGLRGGIKGAFPLHGDYGAFQMLNWAAKYFADALIRDLLRTGQVPPGFTDMPLA